MSPVTVKANRNLTIVLKKGNTAEIELEEYKRLSKYLELVKNEPIEVVEKETAKVNENEVFEKVPNLDTKPPVEVTDNQETTEENQNQVGEKVPNLGTEPPTEEKPTKMTKKLPKKTPTTEGEI